MLPLSSKSILLCLVKHFSFASWNNDLSVEGAGDEEIARGFFFLVLVLHFYSNRTAARVWLHCQQAASLLAGIQAAPAVGLKGLSAACTLPKSFASKSMSIFSVSLGSIPVDHFFANLSGAHSVWFSSLQLLPAALSKLHHPVGTAMHSSEKSRYQSWGWGQCFQVSSFLGFSLSVVVLKAVLYICYFCTSITLKL